MDSRFATSLIKGPALFTDMPVKPLLSIVLYFAFLAIAGLICFSRGLRALPYAPSAWLYVPLAVASLYVTWTEIVAFLYGDYREFAAANKHIPSDEVLDQYLLDSNSDWFDAAYVAVTDNDAGWFWSSQLLNTAAVIVALYWSEGAHRWGRASKQSTGAVYKIAGMASALAYVSLGFLGAMSTSFALFLAQRHATDRAYVVRINPRVTGTIVLLFSAFIFGVTWTPYIPTDSALFGLNLKVLHLVLLIPIVAAAGPTLVYHPKTTPSTHPPAKSIMTVSKFYLLLAAGNIASFAVALARLAPEWATRDDMLHTLWISIFRNNCQKSITADLLFATIITHVFIFSFLITAVRRKMVGQAHAVLVGVLALAGTPIAGVSIVLPLFLSWREQFVKQLAAGPSSS
ncbi:hypothetical protein HDU86_004640 [Geranomyces michiganensis]|nr:hypothetical protein HDU86_004640 [Geranomyces michiganensis]